MKRFVTGVILTSALAVSLPVVTPGAVHAEAAKPAAVATKAVAAAPINVLAGFSNTPRWTGTNTLLITHITDAGKQDYTVQVPTGTYAPVVNGSTEPAELVISPDGKFAAYTNDVNLVFIVDLAAHTVKQASDDKSYKADLQWSKDGSKLYFIQGDKANVVAQLTIADGKVATVLDDKVNYKSDLQVSEDGTKLVYAVEKDGTLTADSVKENNVESVEQAKVELDLAGTEPQVFVFDTTVKDGKALQLTSKADNKSFVTLLHNGRVAYVSADTEKENQPSVLKVVSTDGKETKELLTDLNVLQATSTPDGHLFVLAADKANKKAVYQVDGASGVNVKKWDVPDTTVQVAVSVDAKQIAVTQATEAGEKVAVLAGTKFVDVTK